MMHKVDHILYNIAIELQGISVGSIVKQVLIWSWYLSLGEKSSTSVSGTPPPASPGRSRAIPKAAERYNHLGVAWVSPGVPPSSDGHAQNSSPGRRHPDQMPKPSQVAPLGVEEQRLYFEPLLDV